MRSVLSFSLYFPNFLQPVNVSSFPIMLKIYNITLLSSEELWSLKHFKKSQHGISRCLHDIFLKTTINKNYEGGDRGYTIYITIGIIFLCLIGICIWVWFCFLGSFCQQKWEKNKWIKSVNVNMENLQFKLPLMLFNVFFSWYWLMQTSFLLNSLGPAKICDTCSHH